MTSVLFFEERNVGKHLKFTKRRYTWKFEIDKTDFVIDFFVSRVSGKKKILLNGDIKLETCNPMAKGSFYLLRYVNHTIQILAIGDNSYDLIIDSQSFMSMIKNTEDKQYQKDNSSRKNPINPGFSSVDLNETKQNEDPFKSKSVFGTYWQNQARAFQPKSDVWEDYYSDKSKLTDIYNVSSRITSSDFNDTSRDKHMQKHKK